MEKVLVRWPEGRTDPPKQSQFSVELIYNGKHLIMPYNELQQMRKDLADKIKKP
jgi:hypothetical protein